MDEPMRECTRLQGFVVLALVLASCGDGSAGTSASFAASGGRSQASGGRAEELSASGGAPLQGGAVNGSSASATSVQGGAANAAGGSAGASVSLGGVGFHVSETGGTQSLGAGGASAGGVMGGAGVNSASSGGVMGGGGAVSGGGSVGGGGVAGNPNAFPGGATCTGNMMASGRPGPTMMPGESCLSCHGFTLAGTVFKTGHEPSGCYGAGSSNATVVITDANGTVVRINLSAAGNFYSNAVLTAPYTAEIQTASGKRAMQTPQTEGDCNGCHTQNGDNGAPGRIILP